MKTEIHGPGLSRRIEIWIRGLCGPRHLRFKTDTLKNR